MHKVILTIVTQIGEVVKKIKGNIPFPENSIEQALWVALKTLDESASLSRRMATQAALNGHDWLAERLQGKIKDAEQQATLLRQVLTGKEIFNSKDSTSTLKSSTKASPFQEI